MQYTGKQLVAFGNLLLQRHGISDSQVGHADVSAFFDQEGLDFSKWEGNEGPVQEGSEQAIEQPDNTDTAQ